MSVLITCARRFWWVAWLLLVAAVSGVPGVLISLATAVVGAVVTTAVMICCSPKHRAVVKTAFTNPRALPSVREARHRRILAECDLRAAKQRVETLRSELESYRAVQHARARVAEWREGPNA